MNRSNAPIIPSDRAYARGYINPMNDLSKGGMSGYSTDFSELISATSHIPQRVIPILLRSPRIFDSLDNPPYWHGALRALMEEGYQSFEGLKTGRDYEFSTTPLGGSSEVMEEVVDAKIPRSEVTYNFRERQGQSIVRFISAVGDYCYMHPTTKFANIHTVPGADIQDMLPDMYTFAMMFIEPDRTHRYPVNAWFGDLMQFRTSGTIEGKRDMQAAGAPMDLSIGLTGVYQSNTAGILLLAQSILSSISLVNADPNRAPAAMDRVDPIIAAQRTGYADNVERHRATAVAI